MTRPLRSTPSTAASMRPCSSAYCPLMSMSPTAMRCASLRREKSSLEPTIAPRGGLPGRGAMGGSKRALTPRTKAIMPVDLFGLPADADAVRAVAEAHGLPVVEDACQAWGATYNGRRAGSLGDMGVFSFFPTKNLGGYGDGGLVTAHSEVLVQRARELHEHFA